ncbi:HlyD family secretion protein [Erythrobacter rubeus]|uniref:HlyD family efflux transporter periplasmic adaptor subunit n=1 Tax=Erythrobacter rubeus TaxID=2760803 RepID=A0ABR8KKX4_9SPHN|nr:HlyD family efflux transporter periplasmic adaptor subunit [Erythrobacter rubeus]MBD2840966.1 HlyD family efflux transporter periplasmic adaptor subunit [Erythrobacter rubeus]
MNIFRPEALEQTSERLHGEVVFTQPVTTKLFAGVLFAVLAIGAVWVSIGTYARIETVPGILKTDIASAKIVAPQSGVVTKLLVDEGQFVEQGQVLLEINSDRETAAGGEVAGRGIGALTERRALTQAQMSLATSRASAERARLRAVIESASQDTANLAEQIELQKQVVASNQQIFDQIVEVVEKGFVSRVEFERRRQTLLSSQQALANLKQRRTASLSQASQARSQLASVDIEAQQGISQLNENLQAMAAEQARLEGERSYVLKAPISGRVTALAIGKGRPSQVGRPLMVIVPSDAELTAELYAPTRSIGFVEPGEETRLLYDAFPYQRFGSFGGKVVSVSRIAVDPRETDIPFPFEEPVYRVRVHLDQQNIEGFGKPAPLQAGMTLKANIVLERQTFLAWLLQPLNAVLNRT